MKPRLPPKLDPDFVQRVLRENLSAPPPPKRLRDFLLRLYAQEEQFALLRRLPLGREEAATPPSGEPIP